MKIIKKIISNQALDIEIKVYLSNIFQYSMIIPRIKKKKMRKCGAEYAQYLHGFIQ